MKQVYIYYGIKIIIVIVYLFLLGLTAYSITTNYVCDTYTCRLFNNKAGEPGSKEYVLYILNNFFNNGMWVLSFLLSTIATILVLLFADTIITFEKITIFFLVIFITSYFIISFYSLHYSWKITDYVSNYISDNCPAE